MHFHSIRHSYTSARCQHSLTRMTNNRTNEWTRAHTQHTERTLVAYARAHMLNQKFHYDPSQFNFFVCTMFVAWLCKWKKTTTTTTKFDRNRDPIPRHECNVICNESIQNENEGDNISSLPSSFFVFYIMDMHGRSHQGIVFQWKWFILAEITEQIFTWCVLNFLPARSFALSLFCYTHLMRYFYNAYAYCSTTREEQMVEPYLIAIFSPFIFRNRIG